MTQGTPTTRTHAPAHTYTHTHTARQTDMQTDRQTEMGRTPLFTKTGEITV